VKIKLKYVYMRLEDIKRMAYDAVERQAVENDYIEYKRSSSFKDGILKTSCAYANNYMNREIGLIMIGIEEVNDPTTGEKAIPKRPITGVKEFPLTMWILLGENEIIFC